MVSVFGIGNPLMDYVAHGGFELLKSLSAVPGSMNLIDREQKKSLLSQVREYRNIPGGSCANTMRGLAWLGTANPIPPPFYQGSVGEDDVGMEYDRGLEALGVALGLSRRGPETGASIIVVTSDFERTMFTYLGSCREYRAEDLDLATLRQAAFLYFVGYMWDTENQKQAARKAISEAGARGIQFAFDLADPFVVQRYRDDFLTWVPDKVDILFGNRDEISIMLDETGDDRSLIEKCGYLSPLVVMKAGAKGCYINDNGRIVYSPGVRVEAVDTVGAGDFFSSGFLYGLIKGLAVERCACLANHFAAGIVSVNGCSLHDLDQKQILACVDSELQGA